MEPIIDKLSEIETAASRIMESAVNETRLQDKQADERTARFDAQVEAATQKSLENLRADLQKHSEKELENLKITMERTLASMDSYFQKNHGKISDEIYHKIIRM